MKSIIIFIFVFLGIFIPGSVILNMFQKRDEKGNLPSTGFFQAAGFGLIGALFAVTLPGLAKLTPENPILVWMSFLLFGLTIAGFVGLAILFKKEGSNLGEAVAALCVEFVLSFILIEGASATAAGVSSAFWDSVLFWIAWVVIVTTTGFILCCWMYWRYRFSDGLEDGWRFAGIATQILTIVSIIIITLNVIQWSEFRWPKLNWAKCNTETVVIVPESETPKIEEKVVEKTATTEKDESEELHYAFYNPSLQNDEDESNDFNFGYNPYDFDKDIEKGAEWFDRDFRTRIAKDPALLAADAAFVDSIVGTRYIGVFYDGAKEDWAQAINDAKVAWIKDKQLYFDSLDAFNAFLDTAVKVEVLESDGKETDMMYMNPYTIDGVPDVIVCETDDHKGHYLVYTFKIKENEFKVAYRIECGYQPTNVSVRMKIPTTPKPTNPDKPTTPPPTTTKKKKDPTKGTQGEVVTPNDDPGPGPDTNNGEGATESKAEEHPNSSDANYEEYKETIQNLEQINETQKTGDDSNTPTTETPPKTNVDSKKPKVVNEPEKIPLAETEEGKPIENNENNPAGAWGGPKD